MDWACKNFQSINQASAFVHLAENLHQYLNLALILMLLLHMLDFDCTRVHLEVHDSNLSLVGLIQPNYHYFNEHRIN